MGEIGGLIISFLFIVILIIVATFLEKKGKVSKEGTRKIIHIGVSNWWIIAMVFFEKAIYASILPFLFIIINYISYKYKLIGAMERNSGRGDLGTVYFPISLLILVMATFGIVKAPYVGGIGILIMGYGDGLAAVVGKKFGKIKYYIWGNEKTIAGTVTMFCASLIVCFILFSIYAPDQIIFKSIMISGFATILESLSPLGLDNLTVPLLSSGLYYILFF